MLHMSHDTDLGYGPTATLYSKRDSRMSSRHFFVSALNRGRCEESLARGMSVKSVGGGCRRESLVCAFGPKLFLCVSPPGWRVASYHCQFGYASNST